MKSIALLATIVLGVFVSCEKKADTFEEKINVPVFNADSAYHFIAAQVAFGPRVPGTTAHQRTAQYLISQLEKNGASVSVQSFEAPTFDGRTIPLQNIIASYFPERPKRILLASHWDTRPFADKDKVSRDAPFDGANDGASGVGVLLEVARLLNQQLPRVGVDIIFFDGEDWGEKEHEGAVVPVPHPWQDWWCLGSQYWSRNKHQPAYTAYYGILLDMVGAKGSFFYKEGNSTHYAGPVVDKIWNTAHKTGYSDYFVKQPAGAITDDHVFVNQLAKIPMVDIVFYHPTQGYFGEAHHTTHDNMDLISKETLRAVGSVVMHVIYNEE